MTTVEPSWTRCYSLQQSTLTFDPWMKSPIKKKKRLKWCGNESIPLPRTLPWSSPGARPWASNPQRHRPWAWALLSQAQSIPGFSQCTGVSKTIEPNTTSWNFFSFLKPSAHSLLYLPPKSGSSLLRVLSSLASRGRQTLSTFLDTQTPVPCLGRAPSYPWLALKKATQKAMNCNIQPLIVKFEFF